MTAGRNIGAHDIIFALRCQRKNKIFNTLLTFCLAWALALPATAQVYKWIDEKGVTHYGERPPPDKKAQPVEQHLAKPAPAPGKSAAPDWKAKELEFRGRRIESEQSEAKQQQQDAALGRACNDARDRLARLKSARGIYRLDDKGQRVYQSDEERQASTAQLEQQIAQRCR